MSRSLSATDQTMADYFAALMSEPEPVAASEQPALAATPVSEKAQATIEEALPPVTAPVVAAPPAHDELKPLPDRQPYTAQSAEDRADAEMLARYEEAQTRADTANEAEAQADAEMLARYASQLEPQPAPAVALRQPQPVAKLLAQASAVQREVLPQIPQPAAEELSNLQCILEESGLQELSGQIIPPPPAQPHPIDDEQFQTLYFEVAGLTLAVPLCHLGGIYRIERINKLIGKPDWFMGVMNQRDAQLHVVDSARWVMPEKYTPQLAASLNYQYLIVLGDSPWGLACERLLTAVPVQREAVKWREQPGKRPWLAGLVIDRMCALINVSALIAQLSAGDNNR